MKYTVAAAAKAPEIIAVKKIVPTDVEEPTDVEVGCGSNKITPGPKFPL